MKILGLCVLLFVGVAPLSQAQESPKAANDQTVMASAPADDIVLNLNSKSSTTRDDTTCAFMRTYRVRRDHPGSDFTRPAGYTTCVPSKRFEMKSAVQVAPAQTRSTEFPIAPR